MLNHPGRRSSFEKFIQFRTRNGSYFAGKWINEKGIEFQARRVFNGNWDGMTLDFLTSWKISPFPGFGVKKRPGMTDDRCKEFSCWLEFSSLSALIPDPFWNWYFTRVHRKHSNACTHAPWTRYVCYSKHFEILSAFLRYYHCYIEKIWKYTRNYKTFNTSNFL